MSGAWARRPIVAGAIAVACFAYLAWTALASTTVYYLSVSEVLGHGSADGRAVRVSGRVVDGTLALDARAGEVRFVIADATGTLPVSYRGVKPDLLGYSAEGAYQDVVVEGRLLSDGLRATRLIVKHGPEFESARASDRMNPTSAP